MRMNQRAEFIAEVKSQYDPKEGKRVESGGRSTVLPAHISDLGVERSIAMFGELRRDAKVVRLQRILEWWPQWVCLDGKRYRVAHRRLNGLVWYVVGVD